MDDTLEQPNPTFNFKPVNPGDEDHEQNSSGDEDGGLDWTKLPYELSHNSSLAKVNLPYSLGNDNIARPAIPKRGEKDFEPAEGSGLQRHNLERARSAMFDVLRSTRAISRCGMTLTFPSCQFYWLSSANPSAMRYGTQPSPVLM